MFKTFKYDISSGVVVFLVALPLCIGVAAASGAPPFSGIISGFIGGMIALISRSKFGVSGPSAALPIILLNTITLMGYETFLLSVLIAGVIQLGFGYLRLGFVGYFIPSSVIKGMLASIGIVLILKQFPHAIGYDSDFEGDFKFSQGDGENTFTEILLSLEYVSIGAVILSVISVIIMFAWGSKTLLKYKFFQLFPSSLFVVIVGITINYLFELLETPYTLRGNHLVELPKELFNHNYADLITLPNFKGVFNPNVWIQGLTIAIIASIETLLSVEATDNIDPDLNVTPNNLELKAQGVGNILSGLLGGIPISQVIVRSSANINAGAKSRMSSFYHGILLIGFLLLFPTLISKIPLASLAAILIVLGYKLANVSIVRNVYKKGWDQFIPFAITVMAVLFTDLLRGIGIGLAVSMIYILKTNYELAFTVNEGSDRTIISFAQVVSFLNKGELLLTLNNIPENTNLVISAKKCHNISKDIIELIVNFKTIVAKRKNINVELMGFEHWGLN